MFHFPPEYPEDGFSEEYKCRICMGHNMPSCVFYILGRLVQSIMTSWWSNVNSIINENGNFWNLSYWLEMNIYGRRIYDGTAIV